MRPIPLLFAIAMFATASDAQESPREVDKARMVDCEDRQGGTWEFNTLARRWVCNPQSMKKCVAGGGRWFGGAGVTMNGLGSCVPVAKDGGRPCTDSSECELGCYPTGESSTNGRVTGRCAAHGGQSGCGGRIVGGKVVSGVCVD